MVKMKGFLLVLLAVSVVKCYAMSKSEIEDFSDFLLRTSALDQSLKDGVHSHDEDEHVSDHAWEESGKFEGDLILNERQRRLIVEDVAEGLSRNGLKDSTKRWPNNEVVVYIQREHFSSDQVNAILEGIQDLARASCVKFRPYKKGDRDAVVVQGSRRGCFSQVGYQGGYQVLNLSARHPVGRGCFRHGTVVHEFLHTLGFYHMQSSPDRDDYINVLWENIVEPAKHNFRKYNSFSVSDFGVGYDYDSVLHYSKRAFSSNGKPTLVPKQNGASIGQRIGLSDKDTQKLNKMYCDADSNNFDQDEPSRKPTTIKKKPKNQPFQGQGIGYHQGKTVLIKLPTAEAIMLPEGPSYPYHTFDYFSKTSHAVPSTHTAIQGFGAGKEVTYRTPTTISASNYDKLDATSVNLAPEETDSLTHEYKETNNNEKKIDDKSNAVEEQKDDFGNMKGGQKENNVSDPKLERDLEEAFERLRKIVTARVYPSQSTKSKTQKDDTAYTKHYNPEREFDYQIMNIEDFSSNNPTKPKKLIETKDDYSKDSKEKFKEESIIQNSNVDFKNPTAHHKVSYDSSYGTALPFKRLLDKDLQFKSQYKIPSDLVNLKDIENIHNYSSLYIPDKKLSESESEELYTLLGSPVPFIEPWYKVDEIGSKLQYSSGRPTGKSKPKEDSSEHDSKSFKRLMKLQDYKSLYKPTSKLNNNNAKPQSYFLFSEPVPTSKDWHKQINTEPKIHQYKLESNENLSDEEKQSVVERTSISHESLDNSDENEDSIYSEETDRPKQSLYKPTNKQNNKNAKPELYFLFSEPVPSSKDWHKQMKTEPKMHQYKLESNENLSGEERERVIDRTSISHKSLDNSDENSKYSEETDRPKQSYYYNPDKQHKDQEEKYDGSKEDSSSEKNKDTMTRSEKTPPPYRVKEEKYEKNEGIKSRQQSQNKILNDDVVDNNGFDRSIDDRLSDILSSYTKYDDFDIASYEGPNESSEEQGNQHGGGTKYSNHDY